MIDLNDFSIGNILSEYSGNGMYIALYLAALLYIFLTESKQNKTVFFYSAIFLFATVFNPLFVPLLMKLGGEDATYYRFFWALPMIIVLAFASTKLIVSQSVFLKRLLITVFLIVSVVVCGNFFSTNTPYFIPTNSLKISDRIIETDAIIQDDYQTQNPAATEDPVAIVPTDMTFDIRIYDPSLKLAFGRQVALGLNLEGQWPEVITLRDAFVDEKKLPPDQLQQALDRMGVNYIVLDKNSPLNVSVQSLGAEQIVSDAWGNSIYRYSPS